MGFLGIFLMGLLAVIIIVGGSTIIGITLIIVSIVMKCAYNKKIKVAGDDPQSRPTRAYLVPGIIGCVFMVPLVGIIGLFIYSRVSTVIEHNTSLAYSVTTGNYERAEVLLKMGVNPDCTMESNESAKDGQQTLLSLLCENGGFIDRYDHPMDDVVTEDELDMIRLLIAYGADLEAVDYIHGEDHELHIYKHEPDYYRGAEGCGYTPLLHAVQRGHYDIVKVLVEAGANVKAEGYDGFNVVHIIADELEDSEGEEMLQYLVDKGADVNARTNYKQDATFLAWRHGSSYWDWDNDGIMKIIEENTKESIFDWLH